MITTHATYGSYVVGKPSPHTGGVRIDTYYPKREGAEAVPEMVLVDGTRDVTPVYLGAYHAACGACWLGYAHSEARHDRSVKDATERGR